MKLTFLNGEWATNKQIQAYNNLNNQNYGVKIKQGKEIRQWAKMRIEVGQCPCHSEWFSQHRSSAIHPAMMSHPEGV